MHDDDYYNDARWMIQGAALRLIFYILITFILLGIILAITIINLWDNIQTLFGMVITSRLLIATFI